MIGVERHHLETLHQPAQSPLDRSGRLVVNAHVNVSRQHRLHGPDQVDQLVGEVGNGGYQVIPLAIRGVLSQKSFDLLIGQVILLQGSEKFANGFTASLVDVEVVFLAGGVAILLSLNIGVILLHFETI